VQFYLDFNFSPQVFTQPYYIWVTYSEIQRYL